MLAVVSSCVISPLTLVVMCSGWRRSISSAVTSQGPMLPVASKFLPCVTLNLPCRNQADRAFVTDRDAGDVIERVLMRDATARAANHQRDLALMIELFGLMRQHELRFMPDQRTGRAVEHAVSYTHLRA